LEINNWNISKLKQICLNYNINLNKRKGQCVLIDNNIAKFMAENCKIDSNKISILEIGPGFGIITDYLLDLATKVICIEIDSKILRYLNEKYSKNLNINIINGDAIKIDFPFHDVLISNTPYNISGPLIQKIILLQNYPKKIILTLQKEFVNKLKSPPDPKNYGRLSVIGSLFFNISSLKTVSKNAFFPKPKVESEIIKIEFKQDIPNVLKEYKIKNAFIEFLSGIFPYKNKTVSKSVSFFLNRLKNTPNLFPILSNLSYNKIETNFYSNIKISKSILNKRLFELSPNQILQLFIEIINFSI